MQEQEDGTYMLDKWLEFLLSTEIMPELLRSQFL